MNKTSWIKLALYVAFICLLVGTGYLTNLIVEQRQVLGLSSRFNITVSASQTSIALTRSIQALITQQHEPSEDHLADAQLRMDILYERAHVADETQFGHFITADEKRVALIARFNALISLLRTKFINLNNAEALGDYIDKLEAIEPEIIGLVAQANAFSAEEDAEQQARLVTLYNELGVLLAGLVLFCLAIIVMNLRQNRWLEMKDGQMRVQNLRFEAALGNMSQGLVLLDPQGRLIVSNRRFSEQFGLDAHQPCVGTPIEDILRLTNSGATATGTTDAELIEAYRKIIAEGKSASAIREQVNGRVFWISHQPTSDGGWVITFDDITKRREAEARISYLAMNDAMTDLPNRVMFREKLDEAIAMQKQARVSHLPGHGFAVLLIDIDNFKSINDMYGHPVGDAFLSELARRLKGILRRKDLVARLGGDEFVVLQNGLNGAEHAAKMATRIVSLLSTPVVVDGLSLSCGASIGISLAPEDGMDAKLLLQRADLALYRAKGNGKSTFSFYDASMDDDLEARRTMEVELRRAILQDELIVYYQPQIQILSGETSGFEALVRWKHPQRGMVPPLEFIPLAEETGIINALGEWVLREACKEAAKWPEHLNIAVNISPIQVRSSNLVQVVKAALAQSGLPPQRLELEITESIFLQEDETTISSLRRLREMGVKFAIDDFGTGYSSLATLRRFPFDKLKIDRSFIKDVLTQPDSVQIIHAVIGLGRSLGINTTAEGVENEAQLDLLRAEGCTEVQGFMFGKPMPAAELGPFLKPKMIAA